MNEVYKSLQYEGGRGACDMIPLGWTLPMSSRSKEVAHAAKKGESEAKTVTKSARFELSKGQTYAILAVILLIAAGLRFYGMETAPPGLYLDEAADGANAVQAWET